MQYDNILTHWFFPLLPISDPQWYVYAVGIFTSNVITRGLIIFIKLYFLRYSFHKKENTYLKQKALPDIWLPIVVFLKLVQGKQSGMDL